jgi:hypothetical protein
MKTPALALLALAMSAAGAGAQPHPVWAVELPRSGEAVLRYATLGGDDQTLALRCAPRSGQLQISAMAAPGPAPSGSDDDAPPAAGGPRPASVTVSSGPASTTAPGRAAPDQVRGLTEFSTEISTRSPVVAGFRKTGLIQVLSLGGRVAPPPTPTGMLRTFLAACR